VENVARKWRASFRDWRAVVEVPNSEHRSRFARHRITRARQPRATFSTGDGMSETLEG
jgi:hypothetical protein